MRGYFLAVATIMLVACGGRKVPDVSSVKIDLKVQRFEKDLFSIDSTNVDTSLTQLHQRYPGFLQDFLFNILALPPQPDSAESVKRNVLSFVRSYRPLKDSADVLFSDLSAQKKDIELGLKLLKYYFPDYPAPRKLITFIGPVNSYGNVLTADAMGVGLQLYMGSHYSLYQMVPFQELYPSYISRRFAPEYIATNCMKSVISDMYPDKSAGRPLIEQMIESGKRLYLLDALLPYTPDTVKTGYTASQLQGCLENERVIWSYFVQNDLLYNTDPNTSRDYMNDAPSTQAFGSESPGFIGQFVGLQIVKKWMDKNDDYPMKKLMDTPAKTIFDEARYKP